MCKFIKNNKYNILIAILSIILIICVYIILSNIQNDTLTKSDIIDSFSSFFIGIISIIGIIFNLSDNEKLRKESKKIKQHEMNQQTIKDNNIKLLISHEVCKNLSTLENYYSQINMNERTILVKPKCSNSAWNSLYANLPEVFKENELKQLIKFYEKIDLLLDDKNWLQFTNAESIGAFENIYMKTEFTENDFKEADKHKRIIKEHIEGTLLLKKNLKFLKDNI